ncbi:hypothetical protein FB451DRAFT_1183850 [Mycena latifolia]|nr:hypothetical protein FB451DRAFT_1183850 [Mycena latifolia]
MSPTQGSQAHSARRVTYVHYLRIYRGDRTRSKAEFRETRREVIYAQLGSVVSHALMFFLVICLWRSIPAWASTSSEGLSAARPSILTAGAFPVERKNINVLHIVHLGKLRAERGFTSCPSPGVRVSKERAMSSIPDVEMPHAPAVTKRRRANGGSMLLCVWTRRYNRDIKYFFCDFWGVSGAAHVDFARSGGNFDGGDGTRDVHYCGGGAVMPVPRGRGNFQEVPLS